MWSKYVTKTIICTLGVFVAVLLFKCKTHIIKNSKQAHNTERKTKTPNNTGLKKLNSNYAPSKNFNLTTWNLSIPEDNGYGIAKTISVTKLNSNYQHNTYFYTAADGGMVFKCPIAGEKTSKNTKYTRVELREMLRGKADSVNTKGITKNNWVFGTAPLKDKEQACCYNGELSATLAVNHVTTTGYKNEVGRVIIGQIHANDNEPLRLYYRKLPNNTLGSIYFAHEPCDDTSDEQWYTLIGSKSSTVINLAEGIALNEKFSYTIRVLGDVLTVIIYTNNKIRAVKEINIKNSGYNTGGQYMYFKAGVYNQNKSGNPKDYVQATFYALSKNHTSL